VGGKSCEILFVAIGDKMKLTTDTQTKKRRDRKSYFLRASTVENLAVPPTRKEGGVK
jgi:hypothetical protein